jgi:hypothetical protein
MPLILLICLGAVAQTGGGDPSSAFIVGTGQPPGAAFLGPFHMVVLHLPIGLFSFAAFLELVAWFRPFEGLRRVLAASLGLGVQQYQLMNLNVERARQGLPPIDVARYSGAGVNIGLSPGTQQLVTYAGLALVGLLLLNMATRK